MMRDPVQERCHHFGTAKDRTPLFEFEVDGEDDRCCLVEFADEVE